MPIKVKTDLEFGQSFYIKNDPEQLEHLLVGVIILSGDKGGTQLKFLLSHLGQTCEVWDYEVSPTCDMIKRMGNMKGDTD